MAQPGSIGSMMPASEDTQLRKFADLERSVRELGPSIAKSFQTTVERLDATIATQAEQLADLTALTEDLTATNVTLTAQQATLTAQQSSLTSQQAELTAAQADLEATTAAQVVPKTGTGSGSGFTVDSTSSTTTSFTVTTPAGYTRAVVMASGTIAVANESATADYLYVKIVIAGNSGPEATAAVGSTASGTFWGALSASHALTFGGLTDGQTVTVTISARTGGINFGSSAYNKAMIAGQAIFLR